TPSVLACPHCQGQFAFDVRLAGRIVTCPHCRQQLQMAAAVPVPVAVAVPVASATVAVLPPSAPDPFKGLDEGEAKSTHWRSRARDQAAAHSLGIASMVLGVLALIISFVPAAAMIALPLAGIGILLSIAGGLVAVSRNGHGVGFPIGGFALNGMA